HRAGCRSSTCSSLNQTLAQSVLWAIDGNLFRESGTMMPFWQTRMLVTTNETFCALEQILKQDFHSEPPHIPFSSRF
ncbi:MAG: hypothetical protein KDB27_36100, partial [Planctomycetales bacterium]|nr:hypothetical protein [Planctomycetales bacterium]